MNIYEYIGVVAERQEQHVSIRPLYKIQNGKVIQALKPGERAALGVGDLVCWDHAPTEVYPASFWLFDVDNNGMSKSVTRIKPLIEAIDLSTSAEGSLDHLFKYWSAFPLSYIPSQRAYVLLKNGTWAGPIPLVQYSGHSKPTRMWCYDLNSPEEYIPLVRLAQERFISLKEAPSRKFVSPWYSPEQPVGYIRVADGVVVSSKEASSSVSLSVPPQVMISKSTSEQIVKVPVQELSSAHTSTTFTLPKSQTMSVHAEALGQKSQAATIAALDKQIQVKSQELAQIEQRIAEAKDVKKQELTVWELAALEEEITEKEQVIKEQFRVLEQKYEQKREALSREIAALDRQLEAHKTEHQYQLNKMKQELANEKKAHQQASQQLQETIVPQMEAAQHTIKASNAVSIHIEQSWTQASRKATVLLSEPGMVTQRLKEVCKQRGVDFSTALSVHATLLAGGIPVLAGEGAFDILEIYASCVTAGRVVRLPIAPTMLEPADLIGKPDPTTKRFLPHAAGLADLLVEAKQQRDDLYLVVLDGINRAAVEYYLQPLLVLYHEYWHGERIRSFPLFHSSTVAEKDPYAKLAQMHWTRNILITATLADGMAVIPPPASFWNNAAFVDLSSVRPDLREKDTMEKRRSDSSAIAASTWLMMHERLKKRAAMVSLDDADGPVVVGNDQGSLFNKMVYRALCEYLEDKKKVADTVTVQVMLPRALATDTEGTLVRTLKHEPKGMKHMIKKMEQFVR